MSKTTFKNNLIGDYNPDNDYPEDGDEVSGSDERAWYLDDVAKFMHENDFQLDLEGDQTIDIYTVGFTDGGARPMRSFRRRPTWETGCSSRATTRKS